MQVVEVLWTQLMQAPRKDASSLINCLEPVPPELLVLRAHDEKVSLLDERLHVDSVHLSLRFFAVILRHAAWYLEPRLCRKNAWQRWW